MDRAIRVWDAETGKLIRAFAKDRYLGYLALSPDGHTIAVDQGGSSICLFDLRTGKQLAEITISQEPQGGADALAFTAGGKELASVGGAPLVQFWDVGTAKVVRKVESDATARAARRGDT